MKLSDAILLGSTLGPQAFGTYENRDGSRCALGGALAAIGENIGVYGDQLCSERWPFLDDSCDPCPELCGEHPFCSGALIAHLNNKHRWSRERIAAWVKTIEPNESENSDPLLAPIQTEYEIQVPTRA